MLAKSDVVVCEVLPLIVETRVHVGGKGVAGRESSVHRRRSEIRLGEVVGVALADAGTEAAGEDETLERGDVRIQRAVDVEVGSVLVLVTVPLDERVSVRAATVLGGGIVSVLVSQDGLALHIGIIHLLFELTGVSVIERGERVYLNHGSEQRTEVAHLAY